MTPDAPGACPLALLESMGDTLDDPPITLEPPVKSLDEPPIKSLKYAPSLKPIVDEPYTKGGSWKEAPRVAVGRDRRGEGGGTTAAALDESLPSAVVVVVVSLALHSSCSLLALIRVGSHADAWLGLSSKAIALGSRGLLFLKDFLTSALHLRNATSSLAGAVSRMDLRKRSILACGRENSYRACLRIKKSTPTPPAKSTSTDTELAWSLEAGRQSCFILFWDDRNACRVLASSAWLNDRGRESMTGS